ncbi:MAG: hypothetical protein IT285_06710 [Bdellovibrionales bacterium]|nr:hypothetical protein [Bdellovibrionales bacterium]
MRWIGVLGMCLSAVSSADTVPAIRLYPGYVKRVRCEGRLLVSSVGSDTLVRLEALPKELGCAVLLKPLTQSGRTNLILETSTGTIERILEIRHGGEIPATAADLSESLKAGAR